MVDLNSMLRMDGKTAIVTGGASGIGFEVARFLSTVGVSIALFDINDVQGEKKAEKINSQSGNAQFYHCDVRDAKNVEKCVKSAILDLGKIDFLVNCAGVITRADVLELTEKDWDLTIDIAMKGIFLVSKHVIKHMKANNVGKIVNIGSGWSFKGGGKAFSYCAAKAGVLNMTRAMAIDHGKDNIAINCVCPGDIDTPLLEIQSSQLGVGNDDFYRDQNDGRPLKGPGTPEDVAYAVFFFLSNLSRWVTGSSLVVDGGGLA